MSAVYGLRQWDFTVKDIALRAEPSLLQLLVRPDHIPGRSLLKQPLIGMEELLS